MAISTLGNRRTITILGRKFKVKQLSREKLLKLQGVAVHGLCDNEKRIIYVETDGDETFREKVFHHEVFHAVLGIVGLDQVIPVEFQELLCESFANGIEDLFR
jgi:hypothetical protein